VPAIRPCRPEDFDVILAIINDAAEAYRGVIPPDRWHDPYMSRETLAAEIGDAIQFWGAETDVALVGVMGIQDRGDVALVRHGGIGSGLLVHENALLAKCWRIPARQVETSVVLASPAYR
jgi:hypothetical protein